MPTGTYYVVGVKTKTLWDQPIHQTTRRPRMVRYDVYLTEELGKPWGLEAYTTNALKASLCSRAQKTGMALTIGTAERRWGFEIVSIELAESAA